MAVKKRLVRRVTRTPRVQGQTSARAIAQQADIRADAENDLIRDVHSSRDREHTSGDPLHEDVGDWSPRSSLPDVPPRPGMVQRWVLHSTRGGQLDVRNWGGRLREGWRPRPLSSIPGGESLATASPAGLGLGACMMVEGMVLCEMPVRRNDQRTAYYRGLQQRQELAIEEQLRSVQHPSLPIDRQASTEVTVRHRRPVVQEDDEAA